MRLSKITGCSIFGRAMKTASAIVGCCTSLWKNEQVWDNNCLWQND